MNLLESFAMSTSTPTPEKNIYKFFVPGMKPDVRLRVFETCEFHVHSVLLKLYSGFFRKFLDSPDKKVPASADFPYEWVTEIDDDGSWHLVAAQSKSKKTGKLSGRLKQQEQQSSFHDLMCAIYNRPYMVCSGDELERLYELADYYCCLRIVSRTLEESLESGRRETLLFDLEEDPCKFLRLSIKLRNDSLFRDCLCLAIGPWSKPAFLGCEDPEVSKVCRKARTELYAMIGETNHGIMKALNKLANENPTSRDEWLECMNEASETSFDVSSGEVHLPAYYRKLDKFDSARGRDCFPPEIYTLVSNSMTFDRDLTSGEGDFRDYFLCADLWLELEMTPWDNAEDW